MIWPFLFPALTRPKFCVWCSIQVTFPTLPNVGTFITDGQPDAWRSFSCRVTGKRNWVWNIRRCVTDIILWFPSHKSVCLLITYVNIQCLASFLLLTGEEPRAFTVSSAWWASKQDCPRDFFPFKRYNIHIFASEASNVNFKKKNLWKNFHFYCWE